MASSFKTFSTNDIVSTKTLLHEAIPLTGTVVSGTYIEGGANGTEVNIKNYSHGMFQSVYDYPYLSSSANHVFDLTVGFSPKSRLSGGVASPGAGTRYSTGYPASQATQQEKKINIYNQMAQVLMGHDATGSIMEFDEDGDIAGGGTLITECFFLNFSRLLTKDEIKKGSFSLTLGVSGSRDNPHQGQQIIIKDTGAATDYRINSPAGDYAILYAKDHLGNCVATTDEAGVALAGIEATNGHRCGLIFYQAGIVVVSGSVFQNNAGNSKGILSAADPGGSAADCKMQHPGSGDVRFSENGGNGLISSISISGACDAIRHRICDISFNNTTELNSTIYFCRANHNEFNYSSNPTYTSDSKIVVKEISSDSPVTYITTVGLYSSDNELMAVAKLSEPIKKDPSSELTLRVRLDY